jgi:hypothetical protein
LVPDRLLELCFSHANQTLGISVQTVPFDGVVFRLGHQLWELDGVETWDGTGPYGKMAVHIGHVLS